jgi:hypothetical protein
MPYEKILSAFGGGIGRAVAEFHKKCLINGISQTMIALSFSNERHIYRK